jgi:hypothetical protein
MVKYGIRIRVSSCPGNDAAGRSIRQRLQFVTITVILADRVALAISVSASAP